MIAENIKYMKYCKENISLIENYEKAIADKENMWDCHHKDEIRILPSGLVALRTREELIENGRYTVSKDFPQDFLEWLQTDKTAQWFRKTFFHINPKTACVNKLWEIYNENR